MEYGHRRSKRLHMPPELPQLTMKVVARPGQGPVESLLISDRHRKPDTMIILLIQSSGTSTSHRRLSFSSLEIPRMQKSYMLQTSTFSLRDIERLRHAGYCNSMTFPVLFQNAMKPSSMSHWF